MKYFFLVLLFFFLSSFFANASIQLPSSSSFQSKIQITSLIHDSVFFVREFHDSILDFHKFQIERTDNSLPSIETLIVQNSSSFYLLENRECFENNLNFFFLFDDSIQKSAAAVASDLVQDGVPLLSFRKFLELSSLSSASITFNSSLSLDFSFSNFSSSSFLPFEYANVTVSSSSSGAILDLWQYRIVEISQDRPESTAFSRPFICGFNLTNQTLLPRLPNFYSLSMNILTQDSESSLQATEFFDSSLQKTKISFLGLKQTSVIDWNRFEIIASNGESCDETPLQSSYPFAFDGSGNFVGVGLIFFSIFSPDFATTAINITYLGSKMIYDIECDVWDVRIASSDEEIFHYEIYFEAINWSNIFYLDSIRTIKRIISVREQDRTIRFDDSSVSYSNFVQIDFANFLPNTAFDPSKFYVPENCWKNVSSSTANFPRNYVTTYEISVVSEKRTALVQEFVNSRLGYFRFDTQTSQHFISMIVDANIRTTYLLVDGKNCTVKNFTSFDDAMIDQGLIGGIATTAILFGLGAVEDGDGFVNQGKTSSRGIPCNLYTLEDDVVNMTSMVYLSQSGYSLYGSTKGGVPISAKLFGTRYNDSSAEDLYFSNDYHFLSFSNGAPGPGFYAPPIYCVSCCSCFWFFLILFLFLKNIFFFFLKTSSPRSQAQVK